MDFLDFDQFKAAFEDPYYAEVIVPDEERFMNRSMSKVTPDAVGSVIPVNVFGLLREILVAGKPMISVSEGTKETWSRYDV